MPRTRQETPSLQRSDPCRRDHRSGSGLDPHISPANALIQACVSRGARGVDVGRVRTMVAGAIEPPWLGLIGEPRVNVLLLNVTLDRQLRK